MTSHTRQGSLPESTNSQNADIGNHGRQGSLPEPHTYYRFESQGRRSFDKENLLVPCDKSKSSYNKFINRPLPELPVWRDTEPPSGRLKYDDDLTNQWTSSTVLYNTTGGATTTSLVPGNEGTPKVSALSGGVSLLMGDRGRGHTHSLTKEEHSESSMCVVCGQLHNDMTPHLYDYHQTVDEDLICHICLQPLVSPLDTKCGHTFCGPCIRGYMTVQKTCPVDRLVLTIRDIQSSSIMVKRLLDKLSVVCPNVDYCENVLPRCDLEAHLKNRCKGAVVKCVHSEAGCRYRGPRSALQSHLWECCYTPKSITGDRKLLNTAIGSERNPVLAGRVTSIEISNEASELGISIVGGCDTPLMCIVIQDIYKNGSIKQDGRLMPGDQILEVNGDDLTLSTHRQAVKVLQQVGLKCRLTVYRERAESSMPIEKEEILRVTVHKKKDRHLGIKLVGKKNGPGLYILELVDGGLAALDGRLKPDDKILEINCQDLRQGSQDEAARIIQASYDKVQFVISRKTRPQTPDLIRSASTEASENNSYRWSPVNFKESKDKSVTVHKSNSENLGVSVNGGVANTHGDIPIYITNIQPTGCLGRSKQIKRGDIIVTVNGMSLLNLRHHEAVTILKSCTSARTVTLKLIQGSEVTDEASAFVPSWLYWLDMPISCQNKKIVCLQKDITSGSLGLAIVGGKDCSHGNQPIFIKSVVMDTVAFKDGRLRCGDLILAVNEQSLENVAHSSAVSVLKSVTGLVTLSVISWPGTLI